MKVRGWGEGAMIGQPARGLCRAMAQANKIGAKMTGAAATESAAWLLLKMLQRAHFPQLAAGLASEVR
jgi:hypothetical protein